MLGPEGGCADALGDGSTDDIVRGVVVYLAGGGGFGSTVGVAEACSVYAKARDTAANIALHSCFLPERTVILGLRAQCEVESGCRDLVSDDR